MQFEFVADRPVLDFVATVAERGTTDLEALRSPADLATWLQESGLVDGRPTVSAHDLRKAKDVRDAMFGLVAALIDHTAVSARERELVNRVAAHARPRLELDARRRVRRAGGLDAALAELATDVLDLYDSPDRELLRWCADGRCTRPFVDRSRGHRRRWCGMAGCGDRAKAAAYRQRRRTADAGD